MNVNAKTRKENLANLADSISKHLRHLLSMSYVCQMKNVMKLMPELIHLAATLYTLRRIPRGIGVVHGSPQITGISVQ